MDYAVEFNTSHDVLRKINVCRLFKRIIYPFELVGLCGRHRFSTVRTREAVSQIYWPEFSSTEAPSRASWKVWEKFMAWLCTLKIKFTVTKCILPFVKWFCNETRTVLKCISTVPQTFYKKDSDDT